MYTISAPPTPGRVKCTPSVKRTVVSPPCVHVPSNAPTCRPPCVRVPSNAIPPSVPPLVCLSSNSYAVSAPP
eukprot:6790755-Prymnesium_polylepis.1